MSLNPMSSERIMMMLGFRSAAEAKKLPTSRARSARMPRNIMFVNDVDSFRVSRWFIVHLRFHGRDRRAMFLHCDAQFRDDFRMLGDDVQGFAGIDAEIEEQRRLMRVGFWLVVAVLRQEMRLPHSFAHSEKLIAPVVEERVAWAWLAIKKRRRKIQPVDRAIVRNLCAAKFQARHKQIHGAGEAMVDGARFDSARPPRDSRLSHAAFPGAALA